MNLSAPRSVLIKATLLTQTSLLSKQVRTIVAGRQRDSQTNEFPGAYTLLGKQDRSKHLETGPDVKTVKLHPLIGASAASPTLVDKTKICLFIGASAASPALVVKTENCLFIGASAASPTLVVKTENCLYIYIYIYIYIYTYIYIYLYICLFIWYVRIPYI